MTFNFTVYTGSGKGQRHQRRSIEAPSASDVARLVKAKLQPGRRSKVIVRDVEQAIDSHGFTAQRAEPIGEDGTPINKQAVCLRCGMPLRTHAAEAL